MTRRKVLSRKKRWRCPICHKHSDTIRGLALHLAMKRDEKHIKWRRKYNLLADYIKLKDAQEIIPLIIEIINKEPENYSW